MTLASRIAKSRPVTGRHSWANSLCAPALTLALALGTSTASLAQQGASTAQDSVVSAQSLRITAAIESPLRPIAHVLRDEARRPRQALEFMQIRAGGRVLDLYAADGYYSFLLAAAVGENGRVYAQNPAPTPDSDFDDIQQMFSLGEALDQLIAQSGLETITHLRADFAALNIPEATLDAVLMGQILHDFANSDERAALALLRSFHALLRPGGSLVVIDHAGDAGQDNARLHRMPASEAIRLASAAGFSLADESALLSNPSDRRRRPVFDPMLGRNTDRFLLRFER